MLTLTRTLTLAALLAVTFVLSVAAPYHRFNGHVRPIVVAPDPSSVTGGEMFDVTITLNEAPTSSLTVNLSSSNTDLVEVPSTTTFSANQSTKTIRATSYPFPAAKAAGSGAEVTITAWTGAGSAQGTVTIN